MRKTKLSSICFIFVVWKIESEQARQNVQIFFASVQQVLMMQCKVLIKEFGVSGKLMHCVGRIFHACMAETIQKMGRGMILNLHNQLFVNYRKKQVKMTVGGAKRDFTDKSKVDEDALDGSGDKTKELHDNMETLCENDGELLLASDEVECVCF